LEGSFDPANGVSTVNSTDYDISSASFQKTDNYNLYLFATTGYTDNLYLSHGKIYYCKIWDNGTLVRNFIPCKNTSNVVGMYDTVNKVFYSSETSEPLIAGNETARGGYRIPVVVSPINIWNPNGTDYGWLNINGTFAPSQGSSRRIETEYGKTYTYWSYRSDGNFYNCIALLDENMNMISGTRVVNSGNTATKMQTITINNSSAKYLLCAYYTGGSTLAPEKNMIVEGNTVSSYEPYFSPTTTNIYLSEPLRKLGSYSDYIDFESGKVVRKINYNETTGLFNEIARYSNYSRYGGYQFSPRNAINLGVEKCNYLPYTQTPNGFIVGANTGASFYLYDDLVGVTAEDDTGAKRVAKAVAWLRSLSPRLRIYYVLETTSEESVTLPEITLNKGTNIISIGTTTQPSDMWIKYKGK